MNIPRRKIWIILGLVAGGFLLCFCIALVLFFLINRWRAEGIPGNPVVICSEEPNAVDSLLFNTSDLDKMSFFWSTSTDYRNTFRKFRYGDTGWIFYTSISLKNDLPLNGVIFLRNQITGQVEREITQYSTYNLAIRPAKVNATDTIICSYWGKTGNVRETLFSENFRSYYGYLDGFSIRYGETAPLDMSFQAPIMSENNQRKEVPFMFAFYKRGLTVWFFAFIPDKENNFFDEPQYLTVPSDFLGEIINWQHEQE